MDTIVFSGDQSGCSAPLSFTVESAMIICFCVLGLVWSAFNFLLVKKINVNENNYSEEGPLVEDLPEEQKKTLIELGQKIE
jgi:hypothetical protein